LPVLSFFSPDSPPDMDGLREKIATARALIYVDRVDLLGALGAAALAADGERIIFDALPAEGAIRLSASSLGVEVGKKKTGQKVKVNDLWQDEVETVYSNDACADELSATFEGEAPPARFGLNRTHASQALAALECERVVIRLGADLNMPATIYDPANDDAREVLSLMGVG
jgi:hypothetical protein